MRCSNLSMYFKALMLLCCFALPALPLYGDVVISSFEESGLAANLNPNGAFEGLSEVSSQFRSGNVTFNNDGVYFGGSSWSGFGYSRRVAAAPGQQLYDSSNDLISKPAVGASAIPGPGSSATWGVIGTGGIMTADAGYLFQSLSLTNTLYTWNSMANGDPFAGPKFANGGGTGRFAGQDDFFTVRFENTSTQSFLDFNLADFRGATDTINDTWQAFNLSPLQASQLSISFLGSRESNFVPPPGDPVYFLDTPAYAAVDNIGVISAVPEPGSIALIGLGSVLALRYRRRRASK